MDVPSWVDAVGGENVSISFLLPSIHSSWVVLLVVVRLVLGLNRPLYIPHLDTPDALHALLAPVPCRNQILCKPNFVEHLRLARTAEEKGVGPVQDWLDFRTCTGHPGGGH